MRILRTACAYCVIAPQLLKNKTISLRVGFKSNATNRADAMENSKLKKGILLATNLVFLAGCNQSIIEIDQKKPCEVNGWQKDITAASCEAGQKVV